MNASSRRVWVWRRATRRQLCRGFFLLVVAMFASTSCATQPGGSLDRQPVVSSAAPVGPTAQLGPDPIGPDPAMGDATSKKIAPPGASKPKAIENEPASSAPANAGEEHQRAKRRSDGRPAWWIDAPQQDRGGLHVVAEALGVDLRSARRAAIEAGLHLLEQELGGEPEEWVVQAVAVKPLRAVRGPDSVNRFVGYVLMSATVPQ